MGQSDSTEIRWQEASEKLSELESMSRYINYMIDQYLEPVSIFSSSQSSYDSHSENY